MNSLSHQLVTHLKKFVPLSIKKRLRKIIGPEINVSQPPADLPPIKSADETPKPQESDYDLRMAAENLRFENDTNVHDLPDIFHYWSNKFLAPEKLHPFGITDPEQFFFLYTQKFHEQNPGVEIELVSIGCGNCDMEARLALRLRENGIDHFHIDCLDINEAMLERGKEHARSLSVEDHIKPVCVDFNHWRPAKKYHLVLANQCLHHVLELEALFNTIKQCLSTSGYFLTSDVIGRNGHQRWPEALPLVQEFWQELPPQYRFNRLLKRHEEQYINHDCSTHGFEGIRAQDILPLLIKNFYFDLFIPFSNITLVFIDRPFGHNFSIDREWDLDFIDRVHARDEEAILSGEIKPTQMLAAMCLAPRETQLVNPLLTPEFCVRIP